MRSFWSVAPEGFFLSNREPPEELKSHNVYKKKEYSGKFWLPENPDRSYWGILIYIPGRRIKLIIEDPPWMESKREGILFDLLIGYLADGRPCALINCRAHIETFIREKEYKRAHIEAETLIIGRQFLDINECVLFGMGYKITHLNEWCNNPYKIQHNRKWEKALIRFAPDRFNIEARYGNANFRIELFCERSLPFSISNTKNSWTYDYRLDIFPGEPQKLAWFLGATSLIREFFLYLVGSGVYTLEMGLYFVPGRIGGYLFMPLDIPSIIRNDVHYFSTRYEEIEKEFPNLLAEWFNRSDELKTVIDSFSNIILNEGAYEESIFLNIVQTLEHFYGIIFPGKSRLFEKEKWDCFIEKQKNIVPEFLVEAGIIESLEESAISNQIINRIASLNTPTFRSRLETLFFEMHGPPLMPLLDNPHEPDKAIKEFLKKVEDTRNYLTHYNKDLEDNAFFDDYLRRACSTCWAVLNYWIGKQIGLSDEGAGEIALRASRAMFLVSKKSKL